MAVNLWNIDTSQTSSLNENIIKADFGSGSLIKFTSDPIKAKKKLLLDELFNLSISLIYMYKQITLTHQQHKKVYATFPCLLNKVIHNNFGGQIIMRDSSFRFQESVSYDLSHVAD